MVEAGILASVGRLASVGSGVGGYFLLRITAGQRRYFYFRISVSEAVAILDNLYKRCYNKCNDDNKKVICHQTGKFALYGVFVFMGINSRRAAKNALQRIYIKSGNTKSMKLYAVQGQREKAYLYISKEAFC